MSKKELIDILVKEHGWKEENLKNFNIEALEVTLENAIMIKEMQEKLTAQPVVEEAKVQAPEPASNRRKRKTAESLFEDDDIIEVMNGAPSALVYKDTSNPTAFEYKFEKYGDIEEMSFLEIKTMARRHKKFLQNKWIIILDEDVVRELRLEDFQSDYFTQEDLDEILVKDSQHRIDTVLKSGESIQNAFLRRAILANKRGELESVHVLRKIENHFDISMDEVEIEE